MKSMLYCKSFKSFEMTQCCFPAVVLLVFVCVLFFRMESTEKCEVVIQHLNGKYLKTAAGTPGRAVSALRETLSTLFW